jgi:hypothetical protein
MACIRGTPSSGIKVAMWQPMSRVAAPVFQVGLIVVVLIVCAGRVRANDLASCSQEVNRCLAACRAISSRRTASNERQKLGKPAQVSPARNSFK